MELIRHIKEELALAQEKRHFLKTLQENDVQKANNLGVKRIGEERQAALVARVWEEEFLRFIASKNPKEILYQMINMRDEFVAADFYAKLKGHTFIRTTGLLEDVSGAETLFTKLWNLSYRVDKYHTYEQHWGKLALHKTRPSKLREIIG